MYKDSTKPANKSDQTKKAAASPIAAPANATDTAVITPTPTETVMQPRTGKAIGLASVLMMAVVLYVIPGLIAGFLLGFVYMSVNSGQEGMQLFFESTAGQFAYMVTVEALTIGFVIGLMKITHETWRSIGWRRPIRSPIWPFIKGFLVYFGVLMIIGIILQYTSINTEQKQVIGFEDVTNKLQIIMAFLSLVVLPPLAEEIVFRGFLYTRLRKYFSVIGAAIIVSLIFGFAHLQLDTGNAPLWTAAIDTFVLSLVLVYLREKTGSIWAGIALHALKNFIAFSTLFLI